MDAVAFPKKGIDPDWLHGSHPGSRQASWPTLEPMCAWAILLTGTTTYGDSVSETCPMTFSHHLFEQDHNTQGTPLKGERETNTEGL